MKKLFNFRPLLFGCVFYGLGLVFASFLGYSYGLKLLLLPLTAFCLGLFYGIFNKRKIFLVNFLIFSLIFCCGYLLCYFQIKSYLYFDKVLSLSGVVEGEIVSVNYVNGEPLSYVISNPIINGVKYNINISLYAENYSFNLGDTIGYYATLNKVSFKDYISNVDRVVFSGYSSGEVKFISSNVNVFQFARIKFSSFIMQNFPRSGNFMVALFTGETGFINSIELNNVRFSGVAHIFAVSGLHIGFIFAFCDFICNLLHIKRLWKTVIVFIITMFYSGLTGFTNSSIRAVIMITVYLICSSFGQKYDLLNSLSVAFIIVLTLNPLDIFSAGFCLSFGCILSIGLFSKTFENAIRIKNEKLKKALSSSTSIFVGTSPLILYYFKHLSLLSIPLNIIVIPIISILFSITIIVMILKLIFPFISFLCVAVDYLFSFLTTILNGLNFAKFISFANVGIMFLVLYYAVALLISDKINVKKSVKFGAFCSVIIALILTSI